MSESTAHIGRIILVLATPLCSLCLGVFPSSWLDGQARRVGKAASVLGLLSFACAIASFLMLLPGSPLVVRWPIAGPFELGLYYDHVAGLLLLLVSFLTSVITRYAEHYLEGDPHHGRFTKWLCLTAGSVQALAITGNLLVFALAWTAVSICLHQLLIFYPDRPGALLAARKKFIFSRLGDLCLLGSLILVEQKFHSWDFQSLFHQAGSTTSSPNDYESIGFLLVGCAILKSAQFPFHSWLPDTMETPTPVSALMHAGIINGGGFLIVRLSPLLIHCPKALFLLASLGAFTALFASLTMLTHASIKRALAFSTVAQMGFMMLECGLGAFSLAFLHLTAHSLYKAHAFLSSGSVVQLHRSAWVPDAKPRGHGVLFLITMLATAILTLASAAILGVRLLQNPGYLFLGLVLWFSLGYLLWNLWSHFISPALITAGLALITLLALGGFSLHILFESLLAADLPSQGSHWDWTNEGLACFPLVLFLTVLVFQTQMASWSSHPLCRAFYVHARNGFYFTTLANRLVASLWPVSSQPSRVAKPGVNP